MRSEKLKKQSEFRNVYQNGKKFWNSILVVYASPNELGSTRFGVTASRKVGNSVQRNRAKRLIRESFRSLRPQIKIGFDVVIVARRSILALKCQHVRSAMQQLFQRAKILK